MKKFLAILCFVYYSVLPFVSARIFSSVDNKGLLVTTDFQKLKFDSSLQIIAKALSKYEIAKDYKNFVIHSIKYCEIQNTNERYLLSLVHLAKCRNLILVFLPEEKELLALTIDLTGDAYKGLNDIEIAYENYKASLEIKKKMFGENDSRTAISYSKIASCFSFKIQTDSAYLYSKRAFEICKKHPEHNKDIELHFIYSEYAYNYKIYKRSKTNDWLSVYDSVRVIYNQALDIIRASYAYPNYPEASVLHSIGNTYTDLVLHYSGKRQSIELYRSQALEYYKQDLKIYILLFGEFHSTVSTTYYTLGLLYLYSKSDGYIDQTNKYFQMAINSLLPFSANDDILSIPNIDSCLNYFDLNVLFANKVISLDLIHKKTNDIRYLYAKNEFNKLRINIWEKIMLSYKSKEVSQLLSLWNHQPFEEATKTAFELYSLTKDEKYFSEIFSYSEKAKNSELQKSLLIALKSNSRIDSLTTTQINRQMYSTISIANIQSQILDSSTALIEYFTMENLLGWPNFIFVVDKSQFIVVPFYDLHEIDSLITSLKSAMAGNSVKAFESTSLKLYDRLLQPVISNLNRSTNKLIIVAHGVLNEVPFEALIPRVNKEKQNDFRNLNYLVKKYQVTHALSATILNIQLHQPASIYNSLIGFAPDHSNHSSLPFSTSLVRSIAGRYIGKAFTDENATVSNFIEFGPNHSVIFLATHALTDLENPDQSKLFFSPDTTKDEYLSLGKLYSIKVNTDLAVLSACETSKGKAMYSEGMKSFSRAFVYAGSKSTISMLWKVDDWATSKILDDFFEKMFTGHEKSKSLQFAKLNYLSSCNSSDLANPYYWSGIIITGDDKPIQLNKSHSCFWNVLVLLLMIVIGITIMLIHKRLNL